ncbi:ABC transporter ATP-binding protein [Ottowia thiooxydans]|uniref:Branched-chain amino acid transport system ATP-binding protein n=1 Tax=Ottowia thiooxydans TaxID=219182 RepID=A0ABV2QAM1_9BURK
MSALATTTIQDSKVLHVCDLNAWYGESHVLHGVDFNVSRGEVVTLLGRNGAGKSTTLKAIVGLLRTRKGSVLIEGTETMNLPSRRVAGLGIGYVPEDRGIYATLTVQENLMLPPQVRPDGFSLEQIFNLFPNLKARLTSYGDRLSGGEQQMLAMARVLRTGAKFLLLDEPTEGLAPVIVEQIGNMLQQLKRQGYSMLLVEQNFEFAQSLADRHYIVDQGRVVDAFTAASADREQAKIRRYLGV